MNRKVPTNLPASVHQRLLNLSQETGQEFNFLLGRYAIERLLYRLSQSRYANQFVLKGALLFLVWELPVHRPTRDIDLLGSGDDSAAHLAQVFQEICLAPVVPDGIAFDPAAIQVQPIREEQAYGGQRITLTALLGRAKIPTRVDIGFGDTVIPGAINSVYPALLAFPPPQIQVYPKETVIAEKLHAMVALDMTNSRMKDFFDLWTLARLFPFTGATLVQAIQATFERQRTPLPKSVPTAFTPEFSENPDKIRQWQAFVRRNGIETTGASLAQVVPELMTFLMPPIVAAAQRQAFSASWEPGGPWDVA